MMRACHRSLRARSHFLGFELLDLLILLIVAYPVGIICNVFFGVIVAVSLAAVMRIIRLGKMPGHLGALISSAIIPQQSPALGRDRAPLYKRLV